MFICCVFVVLKVWGSRSKGCVLLGWLKDVKGFGSFEGLLFDFLGCFGVLLTCT